MKKLMLVGVLCTVLTACGQNEPTLVCGGYDVNISLSDDGETLTALINGDEMTLTHAISASGARYVGELNDTIVVLDRDKITNDQFFQSLADQFLSEELKQKNISLGYVPNLLVFENGKIVDVYNTNNQITSYEKLEEFVLKHQEMEE